MRYLRGTRVLLALASCFWAVACVTRMDLQELKDGQSAILDKLDKLERQQARPEPLAAPHNPDASKIYAVAVGDSPTKGPKDAWVTFIEISDFQCPFCARAVGTLAQIAAHYGDDVRFVFKHNPLPFHNRALPAALAAMCAHDQSKFWPMHDALFEGKGGLEDTDLKTYALQLQLDLEEFSQCLRQQKHKALIEKDAAQAAKFGARGTPAFFINGRFISGAQPFSAFKAVIDDVLAKAKASGIPKAKYYSKAIEEGGLQSL